MISPPELLNVIFVMLIDLTRTTDAADELMLGGMSTTVMLITTDAFPPLLFAQTVKFVEFIITVGVPVILPWEKFKPAGSAGSIAHVATTPPD